ncbi:hypothetical protein SUDANB91_05834 [Streptomyces sp. SudanB91_2054]
MASGTSCPSMPVTSGRGVHSLSACFSQVERRFGRSHPALVGACRCAGGDGRVRDAVPDGGLTHEIFDRSVQSRTCRLPLRDAAFHRATGRVPIGALPSSGAITVQTARAGRCRPPSQHVITWEADHHEDPTTQHLLEHGPSRSAGGRPGRGHARRGACRRRGLPAGEDPGHRVLSGHGRRLPTAARLGPRTGYGAKVWSLPSPHNPSNAPTYDGSARSDIRCRPPADAAAPGIRPQRASDASAAGVRCARRATPGPRGGGIGDRRRHWLPRADAVNPRAVRFLRSLVARCVSR